MKTPCLVVSSLVPVWLAVAALASAQSPTSGSINGTVADKLAAVLPGVTVTATSPSLMGQQTSITNDRGQYRFPLLPPGDYQLVYELSGFAKAQREGIHVGLGFTAEVNVQLQVATFEETVTVTGESPVIDTQNTNVQNNFTSEMMKAIPNARDIWSLMAAAPGMTASAIQCRHVPVYRHGMGGRTACRSTA